MKNTIYTLGLAALVSSCASAATINITADITAASDISLRQWSAANTYVLDKVIYVKGTTLDIPAGTIVRGQPDETSLVAGSLVVRPDAKIQIRGTSANPVIFTTAALDTDGDGKANQVAGKFVRWTAGNDAQFLDPITPATVATAIPLPPTITIENDADNNPLTPDVESVARTNAMWGGLIIMGDGFTNNANQVDGDDAGTDITTADLGLGIVEGLTGTDAIYGGVNEQHNGGIIKYVSLRHGGLGVAPGLEINALTLYAVGKDTTVENVDIYSTSDDGIEIFGGDVNIKYANINYADDDGFDVDEGWRGSAQFVFVLQGTVNGLAIGDNGLELDGEDKAESQAGIIDPLPFGKMSNFTVWLNSGSSGARMRAGFAGILANSIFQNVRAPATSGTLVVGQKYRIVSFSNANGDDFVDNGAANNNVNTEFTATLGTSLTWNGSNIQNIVGTGIRIDGLTTNTAPDPDVEETTPSARYNFTNGLLQVRNNSVYAFSTQYTGPSAAFNDNIGSQPVTPTGSVFISSAGVVTGSIFGGAVGATNPFYPITANTSNLVSAYDLFAVSGISHTAANGIDPRPRLAGSLGGYAGPLNNNYVPSPLVVTGYRGAFDRTAASLWTTGWTALNKRGVLKN